MGKLFWAVVVFLLIGAFIIKSAYDYDLSDGPDRKGFISRMGRWVWQLGGNIVDLTSFATKQEWLPGVNETNSTE
jgi:hypothetical protein